MKSSSGPIHRYHYGHPPAELDGFPAVIVAQGTAGERRNHLTPGHREYVIPFSIYVLDQSSDEDSADKNVQDYADRIRQVIDGDETLTGTVQFAHLSEFDVLARDPKNPRVSGWRWGLIVSKMV